MSNPQKKLGDYLTVHEAADYLGVSPWTLRNWDKAGKLRPGRHPQNGYRIYRPEDLAALLSFDSAGGPALATPPRIDWSNVPASDHFVQFYDDDAFLVGSVADFIGAGLAGGEAGVIIATESHRAAVEAELIGRGLDVAGAIADGRYVALDAAATLDLFMEGGAPDPDRFMETIGDVLRRLGDGGRRRIRAFGEMVALLWAAGRRDAAVRLEELWNELAKTYTFTLHCAYPMNAFSGETHEEAFGHVCRNHSRVIPVESYAGLPSDEHRLREIAHLQQKARSLEAEIVRRREVEQALLRREHELLDFFENATEGIHKVGPDGCILWANRAELELLGYSLEEYVGRHIAEFHADRDVIDDMLARLLRGECLYNQPARLRHKDGSIRHVLVHSNGYFENGKFLYTRCFTRDVTEQHRVQEALRHSEQRYLTLLNLLPAAVYVCDAPSGAIRFFNRRAAELWGREPAIGERGERFCGSLRLFNPDGTALAHDRCPMADVLRGGAPRRNQEVVIERPDGLRITAMVNIDPIVGADSSVVGAINVFQDISERRRADEELRLAKVAAEGASRAKDQFLAVLSHELRTPLTPVLMSVASMEAEPGLPPRLREDLEMIRRNVALETRLIDDLLDLSRVINGKLPLHLQEVEVHKLVASAAEMVIAEAQNKGVRLHLDLRAGQDRVPADSARLHQVIWNLLHNAIKFSRPTGGNVTVRTRHDAAAGQVIVVVEDDGIGIDPVVLPRIFNAFEQGDCGVNRTFGGLGLGLAIAKAVVEMHGGSIRADSAGKGTGARFTIELPMAEPAKTTAPDPRHSPARTNGHARPLPLRILLVEDHADTLKVLRRLLEADGHAVTPASCVSEARRAADRQRFDLLISDIGLPDGTGLDIIAHARARHPEIPALALTGFGMEQDMRNSHEAGFSAHLTKPVEVEALKSTIQRLTCR